MADPQTQVGDSRSFYDRISQSYDVIADPWEHASREKGVVALAPRHGESILEIGYGTGHALTTLAKYGAQVTGIELSEGMRNVASQRVARSGYASQIKLELGDARHLPYEDSAFDAAFMSYTLELFDDQDMPRVLSEVHRVLRAGGRLGVVALSEKQHPNFVTAVYEWLHEHVPHLVDCRPIDLTARLLAAGFRIRETVGMSIWGLPVSVAIAVKPDGAFY